MASGVPLNAPFPSFLSFKNKLKECTIIPQQNERLRWSGKPFVRGDKLKAWLAADRGDGVKNVEILLDELRNLHKGQDIESDHVLKGSTACSLVLCILLEIGHGHLLGPLKRSGVIDSKLPLAIAELETLIHQALNPKSKEWASASDIAAAFDKKQWTYFPLKLDFHFTRSLPANHIVPICARDEISVKGQGGKGATADIHQILVPEEFVRPDLRVKVENSRLDHTQFGPCYEFAIKIFKQGNKALFDNELDAYRHLADHTGMIRFLGEYSHDETETTHNILLEFGEMDLAEHFRLPPPVLPPKIAKFWQEVFVLSRAIKELHNFERPRLGKQEKYRGWHADVKPENIIIVNKAFKLADPGFARFEKQTDNQKATSEAGLIYGGTTTYGAPECYHLRSKVPTPHGVDIWSLGCVLSEVATWMTLGYAGIRQYRCLREHAIDELVKNRWTITTSDKKTVHLAKGDYFHNGEDVLPEILQWHDYLRSVMRPVDHVTAKVLLLVEEHLLQGQSNRRITAADLCKNLERLEKSNIAVVSPQLATATASIVQAISNVEEDIQYQSTGSIVKSHMSIRDRKALRSNASFLQLPLNNLSRISEMARTASETSFSNMNPRAMTSLTKRADEKADTEGSVVSGLSRPSLQQTPNHRNQDSLDSVQTITTRTSSTQPSHEPQNVFDAFYNESRSSWGKMTKLLRHQTKDSTVSKYVKHRDLKFIVDNAASMKDYWSEALFLLERLASKAKYQDDDGLDLAFTLGGRAVNDSKHRTLRQFKEAMLSDDVRPGTGHTAQSDMSEVLGGIFWDWLERFKKDPKRTKHLTILVLTDGRWLAMRDERAVDSKTVEFNNLLKAQPGTSLLTRPVSIQFISFGSDADALHRLQRLDNDLKYANVPDIIDTEPSTGDVYKMLLGSFVADIDLQDLERQTKTPTSPQSSQNAFSTIGRQSLEHYQLPGTSNRRNGIHPSPSSQSPRKTIYDENVAQESPARPDSRRKEVPFVDITSHP